MTNIKYEENNRFLTGFIEWPKIYFGSKKWEYEMEFDAEFRNLINGSIYQYDENGDYLDCYPLCDPELPDENFKLQTLIFNQNYFDPLDDGSETETIDVETLQDSFQIMKAGIPKISFNLSFLGDNSEKKSRLNGEKLKGLALNSISLFCRNLNIDFLLHREPFSLRKNNNRKENLVRENSAQLIKV